MAGDRISVNLYEVGVTPVSGAALEKLRARLNVMQREAAHVRIATIDMARAASKGDLQGLKTAVTHSSDWTASLTQSHFYLQSVLSANVPTTSTPYFT